MSLERKDVRAKLDHDMHAAMKAIARADGMDDGEWIESVLGPEIKRRVHAAKVIVEGLPGSGISGNPRE